MGVGKRASEGCLCLHCSNLPNTSGKEKQTVQDVAEMENSGQPRTRDGDSEMQHFLQSLLAPTSDSESESESETEQQW